MDTDDIKQRVATHAAQFVEDGMTVGLGTGSTARHLLHALVARMQAGLRFSGVPTSEEIKALALQLNIPVIDLNEAAEIDLAIDGADEISEDLDLIKGGGGAFLQEKMVEYAANKFIVIGDQNKLVRSLGKFPLPVEVVPYGMERIKKYITDLGCEQVILRNRNGKIFMTDHGHHVLDCHFKEILDPHGLKDKLIDIPGVVETGLFVKMADIVFIGYADGSIKQIDAKHEKRSR